MRSGSSPHLSASISASSAPKPRSDHVAAAPRRSVLGDVTNVQAFGAALEAVRGAGGGDVRLGQVDCRGSAASGYLLHPAVGDACIHVTAVPGERRPRLPDRTRTSRLHSL